MTRTRDLAWLLIGLLLAPAPALAQNGASLALETNRFYSEQGRTLVEGAVEIPYTLLSFEPDGDDLAARARVEVMIDEVSGEELYRTEHEITPRAVNRAMAGSDRVSSIETFAVYAPPGEYVARARVTDMVSEKTFEMSTPLELPERTPLFSDVVLSNQVQKDVKLQQGSYLPYLIGTTMFNPNPRRVFHKDSSLLYFYYEVNPEAIGEEVDVVTARMAIVNGAGETVKDLGERTIQISENRNFDIGAFSVAGLAPGRYRLEIRCEGCEDTRQQHVSPFVVEPPHARQLAFAGPSEPSGAASDAATAPKYYAGYSEAQVDSILGAMDVLLTNSQKQLVQTLNRAGKVAFLNRFWDGVDPDPETPENEFKVEFERRVAYADQFYTTMQTAGHNTDRGEVYVLFGEPTEIIDRPYEATVGPYEIWNYSNQGHTFAFGDFGKDNTYRLIYSTDERFPGDPTIQNLVDTDTSTSMPTFLRTSRGYEQVIVDIRQYRTRTTSQF